MVVDEHLSISGRNFSREIFSERVAAWIFGIPEMGESRAIARGKG
jgi:hypothetical protein